MEKKKAKKRLMFATGDDLYYLTYNILIILHVLKCNGKRKFNDYRKLAFLIDFVSDRDLILIIKHSNFIGKLNNTIDKQKLEKVYSDGLLGISQIKRLIFALEKKGFVSLEKKGVGNCIWINEDNIPDDFFDKEVFKYEIQNVKSLTGTIKRINIITLNTLLDKIFAKFNIDTWATF